MSTSMEASGMTVATEVVAKAARRRFTAGEKLRVLRDAYGCTKPGELSEPSGLVGPGVRCYHPA